MVRRDGRQDDDLRPLKIAFDGLARVDGSARFGFGPTGPSVLTSVSGPIEARLAVENAAQATFEVSVRPLANVPATDSKTLAAMLRILLEPSLILWQNPRSLVQVVAQAMVPNTPAGEDGMIAAFINSSTLALLNAGSVPMKGVVCAVAVGQKEGNGGFIVDPDERTEPINSLGAHGCFAFMFTSRKAGTAHGKCVWTNWRGSPGKTFAPASLDETKRFALIAAGKVYQAVFEAVSGQGGDMKAIVLDGADAWKRDEEGDEEQNLGEVQEDDEDKMEM